MKDEDALSRHQLSSVVRGLLSQVGCGQPGSSSGSDRHRLLDACALINWLHAQAVLSPSIVERELNRQQRFWLLILSQAQCLATEMCRDVLSDDLEKIVSRSRIFRDLLILSEGFPVVAFDQERRVKWD